jgi:hypothetical protein
MTRYWDHHDDRCDRCNAGGRGHIHADGPPDSLNDLLRIAEFQTQHPGFRVFIIPEATS